MLEKKYLAMSRYIPFLKLKSNEIMAIKELDESEKSEIIPFFDLPKSSDVMSEEELQTKIDRSVNSLNRHLNNISNIYLDNYDIDSTITINDESNYKYLLEKSSELPIIPVIGIDRDIEHINTVINAKNEGIISSNVVALRLTEEDFEDFSLVEEDLEDLLENVNDIFNNLDLILDCRVCQENNVHSLTTNIVEFVNSFSSNYSINRLIITGSSIPASIGDIINPNNEIEQNRYELNIFNSSFTQLENNFNVILGDYTIVSPNYSDIDISGNLMRTVTAPKVLYSFEDKHFIIRGRGLQQYGNSQYNDLARIITLKNFYRGEDYSYGDDFLKEKSLNQGNQVTPSSILKPTINAHITYMLTDYTY